MLKEQEKSGRRQYNVPHGGRNVSSPVVASRLAQAVTDALIADRNNAASVVSSAPSVELIGVGPADKNLPAHADMPETKRTPWLNGTEAEL